MTTSARNSRGAANASSRCDDARTPLPANSTSNGATRTRSRSFPSNARSNAAPANNDSLSGPPFFGSSSRAHATTSSTCSMDMYSLMHARHVALYAASSNASASAAASSAANSVRDSFDDFFFFFFFSSPSLSFFFFFFSFMRANAPNAPPAWGGGEAAFFSRLSEAAGFRTTPDVGTVSQPSSVTVARFDADFSRFGFETFRPAFRSSSAWMSSWISWIVFASSTFRRGTQFVSRSSRRSLSANRSRASSVLSASSFFSCLK
mmetsp:Transcript_3445/g.10673  ORF Transcript_3445/g.10673 Transcript_3445/m.10673 type:complete len:263 (-) Transcript_3445:746-1534(-)